jgi:Ca2+-binding RTX toxin-like protein
LLALSPNVSYLGAMERRCHGWLVGAVAALALGAFAPAAGAATANITDDGTEQVLHYTGTPGEVNNLWIEGGPQYQLMEVAPAGGTPVPITVGAGCLNYANPAEGVSCGGGDVDRIEIDLGDMGDTLDINATDVPVIADGGEGNDDFHDLEMSHLAGPFTRLFKGGAGDDTFNAGTLARFPTEYQGGDGIDKMRYIYRSLAAVPVGQTIKLDDLPNDGQGLEGDNVRSDIEYVFGSDQADVISGTANDDYLVGNGGADQIDGLGGVDRLFAGDAATNDGDTCDTDVLNGGDGNDELWLGGATTANGEADNDTILSDQFVCTGKSDIASGGPGTDGADFWPVTLPGLSVSLDDVGNDGVGGTDNYKPDIENLSAGANGMTLIGSAGDNHITGGAGNDLIDGGLGADQMSGGGGIDTVDYSSRTLPLTLTIGTGDTDGQAGENDGIVGDIENVRGGSGVDIIEGNELNNVLDGGPGADNISGGDGVDAVDYSRRTAVVNVTLNGGVGTDGEAGENDTIAADVEGAFGGAGNDTLVGAAGNGFLSGFGGNDDLSDVGGIDTLDAGTGDDEIDSVDGAVDHDVCGPGTDKVTKDANDTVDADCADTTTPPVDPPTDPPVTPPTTPPTTPPVTPPAKPPVAPIDHTAPNATLALGAGKLGKLLSSGLKVSVKSNEGGSLSAVLTAESNTVRLLKRHGVKGVLASGRGTATGGATKTLTLRLGRKARKALRGAAVAKLKLVVTVTDGTGNKLTLTKHLKIKS